MVFIYVLKLIENNFPNTRFHFFYLFSLISMPFIRFKLFNRLTNTMGRLDVYLNKVFQEDILFNSNEDGATISITIPKI